VPVFIGSRFDGITLLLCPYHLGIGIQRIGFGKGIFIAYTGMSTPIPVLPAVTQVIPAVIISL
jgi:hypothetical protein